MSETQRQARVVGEVEHLLTAGTPLPRALALVQNIENAATRGEDLPYGPFLDVTRAWERREQSIEVMPSPAAIVRTARYLFARSIGSFSSGHHADAMAEFDRRSDANKDYWLTQATELLRHAAGLTSAPERQPCRR